MNIMQPKVYFHDHAGQWISSIKEELSEVMSQNVRLQAAQKTSVSAFLHFNTVNVVENTAETDENSFLES